MTRREIIALTAILIAPVWAHAETVSQKQADLKEALRVQQLICDAMADIRARGGVLTDNNFSLCFIDLEQQRAAYQRAIGENGGATAAAASASLRIPPAGTGLSGR